MNATTIHAGIVYGANDASDPLTAMYGERGCGPQAILDGVRDLIAGRVDRLTVCAAEHPHNGGRILERFTVAVDDKPKPGSKAAVRFVGEDGSSSGVGSHSVVASWFPWCDDPAAVACNLVARLAKAGTLMFRLVEPNGKDGAA